MCFEFTSGIVDKFIEGVTVGSHTFCDDIHRDTTQCDCHQRLILTFCDQIDPQGFDIVANATPVGMNPADPYPLDPELLDPSQLVTEMIMKPDITSFLLAARKKGCEIQGGYEALKGQAKATMEFFGLS